MDRFRRFDEAYYHRFYESPQTRVVSPEEHANLASFVVGFARWNHIELKSVLDIRAIKMRTRRAGLIPTGGLLPKLGTDRYPWYPKMRVFTPPGSMRWDAVMDDVAAALALRAQA